VVVAMVVHTLLSRIPTGLEICHRVSGVRHCYAQMRWRFGWTTVGQYFLSPLIIHGLLITLLLTVIAMTVGISLGIVIAILRLSTNRLMSGPAWVFTWFFRGTPVYVQLLFWFNIAYLYLHFNIGIPFVNHSFWMVNSNSIFVPFTAGCVGLGLNEAAYFSEIARSGLISVDEGQVEAATALGMTRAQTLRLIVLPQAMRVIIPPSGNEVISMLKTTSLCVSISVIELLGAAENIAASNYQVMPMLITASMWYLICTTILSIGQYYLERHFARGALRTPPPTPIQRLRQDLRGIARLMGRGSSRRGALA